MSAKPTYAELEKRVKELEQREAEHRRQKAALRKSEEKLKEFYQLLAGVLDHTHMMAAFLDPQFNFIWVNQAYAETCKHGCSYFPGKNHFDLYPHAENQAIFQRVVNTGEPFFAEAKPFEFPDQPERGVTFWNWSLIPIKDSAEKVTGLVFTLAEVTGRVLAEKELRRSEEKFRTLIENVIDWVWQVDEKGFYTYVSPQAEKLMGYAASDILGKTPFDFMSRVEAERVGAIFFDAATRRERVLGLEDTLLAKDGSEVIFETNATPLFNAEGDLTGYMGTCRDITRRKRDDEERRLNEARLEALLQLNDMQGSLSDDLALFALEKSTHLTGSDIGFINFLSEDEQYVTQAVYTQDTLAQCELPKEQAVFEISECGLWSEACRQRRPIVMNDYTEEHAAKIGFPSGHPVLRRFVSIPVFEEGRVVAVAALGNKKEAYDAGDVRQFRLFMEGLWQIMRRQQAQNEKERLLSAIEQAAEMMIITDPEGAIQYVNPAFEHVTGYSAEEVKGQNPRILKSGRQNPAFYRDLWKTITEGKNWQGRFINRRKDGTLYTEEASISPVMDGKGGISNFVAVKRDITSEMNLERRLVQAQKMEAIGTLAGGIAHDFNNILSAMIGFTEIVEEDLPEGSRNREDLGEVITACNRARDLVKQILQFSRQGEQEVKPLRLDLIVNETLKMLRSSLPTSIEIRQSIAPNPPAVVANHTQAHQIIMNLCTNAAQAIEDEHGVIEVVLDDVQLDKDSAAGVGDLKPGRYVRLKVRDSGTGISGEIRERIFEPYFTTKKAGEGTGLGLSVVYGIVKEYGGDISVESPEGGGTTFTIYFPTSSGIETDQVTAGQEALPLGRERILFVDDEPPIAKLGEQHLKRLGYRVTTRQSSREALELFQADPRQFDLVVTDLTMPHMTGDELALEILNIRPDIPIIMCTGYSKRLSEKQAMEIGIQAFVMKPLAQHELANTIRRVLDEKPRNAGGGPLGSLGPSGPPEST